jgi:cytosine/adenosine deaminase-related metal-dependent hydrolase
MKAIKNVKIFDYEHFIEDGYIVYSDIIEEVGRMEHYTFEGQAIDGKGKLVIPGLVNGHTHIYSMLFRGLDLPYDPKSFKDILEQLWWKFDEKLGLEEIYTSGLMYGIESLKNGVTTIIDHHASGIIPGSLETIKKSIVDQLNMRLLLAFETSDRYNVSECIEENKKFLDEKNEFYTGLFGMHASMSLSDETLGLIKENLGNEPIHVHVAESQMDEEDSIKKYGKPVVNRFDAIDLLNDHSILAHCIHINEAEAEILRNKKVTIALNPSSNLNNNVGIFDWHLIKDINIMIGTDGLGSNIAQEIYLFNLLAKKSLDNPLGIEENQLIKIIENSYTLVNKLLGIKIGKIRQHYKADFLLIDYNNPTPMTQKNAFSHILYGVFNQMQPEKVIINGKEVFSNYKAHVKPEVYEKSVEVSRKLFKKFGDQK